MTTIEFSNEFDTLLDSYRRFKDFDSKETLDSLDFNEYEKSVFLTEAQLQIVVELYTGRNDKNSSFEKTEELRSYLRNLIRTATLKKEESEQNQLFKLPKDLFFITYEEAKISDENAGCHNGNIIAVVPITQDEYNRIKNNPFKKPNERRALRLDRGLDVVELVSKYILTDYTIMYICKPTPIILSNFSEVSIDGFNKITECKLDSGVHRLILERAVLLAIRSKGISDKDNV